MLQMLQQLCESTIENRQNADVDGDEEKGFSASA